MRQITLIIIAFLTGNILGYSQLCDDPSPPSNRCQNAPFLCDLDGYCSRNSGATNTGTPNAFCGQVENNNWVQFIAGSTSFTIEISVSNCNQNDGLQAQFFSSSDCKNFTAVSDCIDPVRNTEILTAENLIIGNTYYLMMDGKGGDVCDYSYNVIDGLTRPKAIITPQGFLCEQGTMFLTSPSLNIDGMDYQWSTNDGHIITDSKQTAIEIAQPGTYKLILSHVQGCKDSVEIAIFAEPNPNITIETPKIIDCMTNTTVTIEALSDQNNSIFYWKTEVGNIVSGKNTPKVEVSEAGIYHLSVTNPITGCSSAILVDVFKDISAPNANIEASSPELNCIVELVELGIANSSTGSNFIYEWISNNNSNSLGATHTIQVTEPGTYSLLVTNTDNDCQDEAFIVITLNDKEPSGTSIQSKNPCHYETTGSIEISGVIGGTSPFVYSIDENDFSASTVRQNLSVNEHSLTIKDATGCEWDTTFTIQQIQEQTVDLGNDIRIEMGDKVNLTAQINFDESTIDSVIWFPNYECGDCLEQIVEPYQPFIQDIKIIDVNGCESEDRIQVYVGKIRKIYIPDAFTPNGDGINDIYYLLAGNDVESILELRVYNSWGAEVYAFQDFHPNQTEFGWDGLIKGEQAQEGIYAYFAKVKFIDGKVFLYSGDLTLIR